MAYNKVEAANKMTIERVCQLYEAVGLVLTIEDGKITNAEYKGGRD